MTVELTILIPVRIDSDERKANLDYVISFFLEYTSVYIIVLEADRIHQCLYKKSDRLDIIYMFDDDPIFYKTKYMNYLLEEAKTDIVGIWDSDVIVFPSQIVDAVHSIKEGITMCFPYDGDFVFCDKRESEEIRQTGFNSIVQSRDETTKSIGKRPSVGGAFLVNKYKYMKLGAENETFYGWGAEDVERFKRMEILQEPISRIRGSLYHLYHPRGINSGFDRSKRDLICLKELIRICKMDREQLLAYINSEEWNSKLSVKNKIIKQYDVPPLVSVIMPVYNNEEYVATAIKSVLRQSYENFEFIIINDGSTDSSVREIMAFDDKRILLIDHVDNKGNYQRRNEGIRICKGKYIAVMDSDDEALPFRLETQVAYLEEHQSVLTVGSQFDFGGMGISNKPLAYELIKVKLIENNMFLHPSLLIRKDIFNIIGGYDENIYYSADYDLVCRIALHGEIVNMPDILMKYRVHESQISIMKKADQRKYADLVRLNYLANAGFSLSIDEQSLFNRMINGEIEKGTKQEVCMLIKKIVRQSNNSFFDSEILQSLLSRFSCAG